MKGFKDSSGKFHPIKDYKGVRKSRDQSSKTQGVKYDGLGRRLPVKLGKIGDIVKVSKGSGIDSGKVGKIIGRKPAQDFPQSATDWYQVRIIKPENMKGVIIQSPRDRLEKIEGIRKARDEPLPPFVKKEIIENLADLDLMLKGLRDERRDRNLGGDKATGELSSQIRLIGGARNSILSLLDQVPEPLHREIAEGAHKIYMEYKE